VILKHRKCITEPRDIRIVKTASKNSFWIFEVLCLTNDSGAH